MFLNFRFTLLEMNSDVGLVDFLSNDASRFLALNAKSRPRALLNSLTFFSTF